MAVGRLAATQSTSCWRVGRWCPPEAPGGWPRSSRSSSDRRGSTPGWRRSGSKAEVHFEAFARLLRRVWERAADGAVTFVTGDKHGGRHYYLEPLSQAFPDAWIDRGPEGPDLSRYTIRDARPTARADA